MRDQNPAGWGKHRQDDAQFACFSFPYSFLSRIFLALIQFITLPLPHFIPDPSNWLLPPHPSSRVIPWKKKKKSRVIVWRMWTECFLWKQSEGGWGGLSISIYFMFSSKCTFGVRFYNSRVVSFFLSFFFFFSLFQQNQYSKLVANKRFQTWAIANLPLPVKMKILNTSQEESCIQSIRFERSMAMVFVWFQHTRELH